MRDDQKPALLDLKPALLDYDQLRAYLGNISRSKAKEIVANGDIVKVNIGTRTMFLRSSVDAYIQRRVDAATDNDAPLPLVDGGSAERTKKRARHLVPPGTRPRRRSQDVGSR